MSKFVMTLRYLIENAENSILHSSCSKICQYLVFLCSMRRLLVTASIVPSSPNLVTLMKEALSSYETSVLTRATRRNIPEDTILHSHRHKNLKSYNFKPVLSLSTQIYCLGFQRHDNEHLTFEWRYTIFPNTIWNCKRVTICMCVRAT
jgi:hypothetical protein